MPSSRRVVVVGSVNLDLTARVRSLPASGATVLADGLDRSPGGKGANQALAAGLSGGAPTRLIAAVGDDASAAAACALLRRSPVDLSLLQSVPGPTGTAMITLDRDGANTIVVVPGANSRLRIDEASARALRDCDVMLAQLEVPQSVLVEAAQRLPRAATLILNAAPAAALEPRLMQRVDVLVVNEEEACALGGDTDPLRAATRLSDRVPSVVVTLGSAGSAMTRAGAEPVRVPAPTVRATDTVGAGDAFCGVLAAAWTRDVPAAHRLRLASAAAALSVQRPGAQASLPGHEEVRRLCRHWYG